MLIEIGGVPWEVIRFGKGEKEQAVADRRRKAHRTWVNRQLQQAQEHRDLQHKREIRSFYADKRKKAKEGR